jgi:hypothetical protein
MRASPFSIVTFNARDKNSKAVVTACRPAGFGGIDVLGMIHFVISM